MIRNALYLIRAVASVSGCSGKIPLGNGPGNGDAAAGAEGGPGHSVMGGDQDATTMMVGDDAGIGVGPNGDATTREIDAGTSVGPDGGSCFPDCTIDAGIGVGPTDASIPDASVGGFTPCGGAECGPGESCVATTDVGGPPCFDGGPCSTPLPNYVCQITPHACKGDLTCGCSASLCLKTEGCFCAGVKDNVLSCTCEVP
jgi:hypothetical protein